MASNVVDLSGPDDDHDDSLIVINDTEGPPNQPDELIIDADQRPRLEKYVEKINQQYSVEVRSTVLGHYNMVNFLPYPHNRPSVAAAVVSRRGNGAIFPIVDLKLSYISFWKWAASAP